MDGCNAFRRRRSGDLMPACCPNCHERGELRVVLLGEGSVQLCCGLLGIAVTSATSGWALLDLEEASRPRPVARRSHRSR